MIIHISQINRYETILGQMLIPYNTSKNNAANVFIKFQSKINANSHTLIQKFRKISLQAVI